MRTASSGLPVREISKISVPSGLATSPRKISSPSTMRAWPAIGVLQLPSRADRNARSQSTAILVGLWHSALMYFSERSSSSRHWMPIAPCATAGSISSHSMMEVRCSSMSIRFRPAYASSVASTTPSFSLRKRVCTLPRKLTTFSVGFLARICDCLLSEALPITEPSGRSAIDLAFGEMNTSRVSSRSRLHGSTVPSGIQVGTSFIECTQMSTSLASRATSSSFVKRPLPPISVRALSRIMSPVDFIAMIWIAPSSVSSGNAALSSRSVSYACARANGEPRVPMRTSGLSAAIETAEAREAVAARVECATGCTA
mmetsp:Transcript_25018/g.64580  ORF Transcript_25018/g.64580 Transcript_25018/m.64580 type:complete len:314 (-) Transcript_25018:105-1046(-)